MMSIIMSTLVGILIPVIIFVISGNPDRSERISTYSILGVGGVLYIAIWGRDTIGFNIFLIIAIAIILLLNFRKPDLVEGSLQNIKDLLPKYLKLIKTMSMKPEEDIIADFEKLFLSMFYVDGAVVLLSLTPILGAKQAMFLLLGSVLYIFIAHILLVKEEVVIESLKNIQHTVRLKLHLITVDNDTYDNEEYERIRAEEQRDAEREKARRENNRGQKVRERSTSRNTNGKGVDLSKPTDNEQNYNRRSMPGINPPYGDNQHIVDRPQVGAGSRVNLSKRSDILEGQILPDRGVRGENNSLRQPAKLGNPVMRPGINKSNISPSGLNRRISQPPTGVTLGSQAKSENINADREAAILKELGSSKLGKISTPPPLPEIKKRSRMVPDSPASPVAQREPELPRTSIGLGSRNRLADQMDLDHSIDSILHEDVLPTQRMDELVGDMDDMDFSLED